MQKFAGRQKDQLLSTAVTMLGALPSDYAHLEIFASKRPAISLFESRASAGDIIKRELERSAG